MERLKEWLPAFSPAGIILAAVLAALLVWSFYSWKRRGQPVRRRVSAPDPGPLYFSELYGGRIYLPVGSRTGALGEPNRAGQSVILQELTSGEQFCLQRQGSHSGKLAWQVLCPPQWQDILWPCDLVRLRRPDQKSGCTILSDRFWGEDPPTPEEQLQRMDQEELALVMPMGGCPSGLTPLSGLLAGMQKSLEAPNYITQPRIARLALSLAEVLARLEERGYSCLDLHPDRLLVTPDDRIWLDYSSLICPVDQLEVGVQLKEEEFPLEFAEPLLGTGKRQLADLHTARFSLAALLFYLLFGAYPYDGRLMSGYADGSVQQHFVKFKAYHQAPVFLFDPVDDSNRLVFTAKSEPLKAAWEQTPLPVQQAFVEILGTQNALREQPVQNLSPAQWAEVLRWLPVLKPSESAEPVHTAPADEADIPAVQTAPPATMAGSPAASTAPTEGDGSEADGETAL